MFRSTSTFDKLLDKATSHLLMEPEWPTIIQICDLIRQNDVQPKYAFNALKKKLSSPNQHTALYALLVLESLVKNCGQIFHEELTVRANCDALHDLARTTTHENVRQKLLELIQAWTVAFRKNPKHSALKDVMGAMKAEGYKFPASRESDAMFVADTAPEWADGDVCHRCRVAFGLMQRRHHCRACGQVFCAQCTQKSTTLPKYGIEKEVRVCDACYDQATKPTVASKAAAEKQESDLPLEYVNSSLAKQSQAPPRKTEEELREEEELQLALALSQSEAEAKEKGKYKFTSNIHNNNTAVASTVIKSMQSSSGANAAVHPRSPSPLGLDTKSQQHSELAKYLNRSYWESINQNDSRGGEEQQQQPAVRPSSPSAPATAPIMTYHQTNNNESKYSSNNHNPTKYKENGTSGIVIIDNDLEEFINTLRSQVEIFINRMKSNSSRGRSIANDTSVQTLFLNITAMHSRLLHYIQEHDDSRLHYERLQDKLTQVKDARAALDDLREEHREKLRREAEEADRLRQLQMAHKLEIMRKKKQEYLQYQRQMALQRIQEQEREMQMRQEHQKQQYLMGPQQQQYVGYIGGGGGSPMHSGGQQFVGGGGGYHTYQYGVGGGGVGQVIQPQSAGPAGQMGLPPNQMRQQQQMGVVAGGLPQSAPPGLVSYNPQMMQQPQGYGPMINQMVRPPLMPPPGMMPIPPPQQQQPQQQFQPQQQQQAIVVAPPQQVAVAVAVTDGNAPEKAQTAELISFD